MYLRQTLWAVSQNPFIPCAWVTESAVTKSPALQSAIQQSTVKWDLSVIIRAKTKIKKKSEWKTNKKSDHGNDAVVCLDNSSFPNVVTFLLWAFAPPGWESQLQFSHLYIVDSLSALEGVPAAPTITRSGVLHHPLLLSLSLSTLL